MFFSLRVPGPAAAFTALGVLLLAIRPTAVPGGEPIGDGALQPADVAVASALQRGDVEPNDTLATSVETGLIDEGQTVIAGAYLGDGDVPEKDVDLFRFEVDAGASLPRLLTVSALTDGSELDAYLRVFDETGLEIANNDDEAYPDLDPHLRTYLLGAGAYFVGVSASGNANYDPEAIEPLSYNPTEGSYDLTITLEASAHLTGDLEPNDDTDNPTSVSDEWVLFQFIGDGTEGRLDVDVYQIIINSPKIIEAEVFAEGLNSPLDPVLSLRSSAGTEGSYLFELAANDNATPDTYDARIEAAVFEPGAYFLVVSGAGNYLPVLDPDLRGPGSVGYYDLHISTRAWPDFGGPYEPNDSIIESTQVDLAETGEETFVAHVGDGRYGYTRGDVDVYEVVAPVGAVVTVDVDADVLGSELDSLVIAFDYYGRVIAANDNDGQTTDSLLSVEIPSYSWWPIQYWDPDDDPVPMIYVMVMGTQQSRPTDPFSPLPHPSGDWDEWPTRARHAVIDASPSTGAYEVTFGFDDCCMTDHGSGCGDPLVEACVCDVDPYCCQVEWDEFCVDQVTSAGCGLCPGGPGHNCCAIGHGAGCSDPDIEACVCDEEPSCCTDVWDSTCVYLVWMSDYTYNIDACGTCPHDCCVVGAAGCTDPAIRACVCEIWSDCCETAWYPECVAEVAGSNCGTCPDVLRGAAGQEPPGAPPRDAPLSQRVFATTFDYPPNGIIELDAGDGSVINRFGIPEDLVAGGEGLALLDETLFYLGTGRFPRLYWLDPAEGDVLDHMFLWSGSGYYGDVATFDGRLFVTDMFDGSIHELDPVSRQAIRTIDVAGINGISLSGPITSLPCPDALYAADAHDTNMIYAIDPDTGLADPWLADGLPCPCEADFDGDGDVDADDQAFYDDCQTADGSVQYFCLAVDLDCDNDQDGDDQAILDCQNNGPDQPPNEDCCPEDLPDLPLFVTALGGTGSDTLYISDSLEQSIEVYDRTGVRIDSFAVETRIGAIGGEPLVSFADANGDGSIDLNDFEVFAECLTGPGGEPPDYTCCMFDTEPDGDVDFADFAILQGLLAEGTLP